MNTLPKFSEQYDKIIDAYFKDEINPLNAHFCFCGTLCNNTNSWFQNSGSCMRSDSHGYSGKELYDMEKALMNEVPELPDIEDKELIFKGMCAALEVLRKIHKEHGEVIDEVPVFTKRQLQTI